MHRTCVLRRIETVIRRNVRNWMMIAPITYIECSPFMPVVSLISELGAANVDQGEGTFVLHN
jgi:hypothetical protein